MSNNKCAAGQRSAELSSYPENTRMVGLMLDREHVADAEELIRVQQNQDAITLLRSWKNSSYPFVLVAGQLYHSDGGSLGGFAANWDSTIKLFRMVSARLDSLANDSVGSFTSIWMLFLTEDRIQQMRALIAEAQQVAGRA